MTASGIARLVAWGGLAVAVAASGLAAPDRPPPPATRAAGRTFPLAGVMAVSAMRRPPSPSSMPAHDDQDPF